MQIDGIAVHLHRDDLPEGLRVTDSVAVDSETMGLSPGRDRLCLVQLALDRGDVHLVQFARPRPGTPFTFAAPRLAALLVDPSVTKIFHYARFDVAVFYKYLGLTCAPVYCTKVASRLVRTYTDRHGLKDLCRELLGIELSKEQQSSDWGAARLTDEQLRYASRDVIHLHRLREKLDAMLDRESRRELAQACFDFLPHRARLDVDGWADQDILAY